MKHCSALRMLALTAVATTSLLAATQAAFASRELAHIGAWSAEMGGNSPSQKFCVMKETFRDGGAFGFRFDHAGVHMYAYKPQWHLSRKGKNLQMIVNVNGVDSSQSARVATQHLVKTDNISEKTFDSLMNSKRAHLRIMFTHPVTWTLNMNGARQIAGVMDRCVHQQGV